MCLTQVPTFAKSRLITYVFNHSASLRLWEECRLILVANELTQILFLEVSYIVSLRLHDRRVLDLEWVPREKFLPQTLAEVLFIPRPHINVILSNRHLHHHLLGTVCERLPLAVQLDKLGLIFRVLQRAIKVLSKYSEGFFVIVCSLKCL